MFDGSRCLKNNPCYRENNPQLHCMTLNLSNLLHIVETLECLVCDMWCQQEDRTLYISLYLIENLGLLRCREVIKAG